MLTPQAILEELKKIKYPGFSRDIVSFGMIKDVEIAHAGVTVILNAPSAKPEVIAEVTDAIRQTLAAMPEAPAIKVEVIAPLRRRSRARCTAGRFPASSTSLRWRAARAASASRQLRLTSPGDSLPRMAGRPDGRRCLRP